MYNLREKSQKFKTVKNCKIYFDENLSNRTTFKLGGNATVLIEVETVKALIDIITIAKKENIPFFVLGGGANVAFSDLGYDGLVIALTSLKNICFDAEKSILHCASGTLITDIVDFCTENSLTGFETFSGLPGTAGGATYMNARCFDKEISDVVGDIFYIDYSDSELKEETLLFNKNLWAYKISPFTNTKRIITGVCFNVKKTSSKEKIALLCEKIMQERISKGHFKYPSAGSMFKNNRDFGKPSGTLIDEAGLKGFAIGGAEVSSWHGNIIINKNHATQKDVKDLVAFIIEKVKERTGFTLESEVIFL